MAPALTFVSDPIWTATGPGVGTLDLVIGAADAGTGAAPAAGADIEPPSVVVTLDGGATFADGQPAGCEPGGQAVITCVFAQPADGATVAFSLTVEGVTATGQTARAEVRRGDAVEASTAEIPLVPYESGLSLGGVEWRLRGAGAGDLVVTLGNTATWDVEGVTVWVDPHTGDVYPDPAMPLPGGCTVGPDQAGAPATIACTITVPAGGGAVTLPLVVEGEGQMVDVGVALGETLIGAITDVPLPGTP